MTSSEPEDRRNEEFWRDYLMHPDSLQTVGRRFFSRIPSSPRCQLCASPLAGPGAPLMRLIGKRPSDGNPNMCNTCQKVLIKHHGGAEVEASMRQGGRHRGRHPQGRLGLAHQGPQPRVPSVPDRSGVHELRER